MFNYIISFTIRAFFLVGMIKTVNLWLNYNKKTTFHPQLEFTVLLYKGNIIIAGRKSPYSLYREDFATFGQDDVYDQMDSKGFINLFGLPIKVRTLLKIDGGEQQHLYEEPDYSEFKRD